MIRNGSFADVPFMRSMLAHAYAWRVNALDADIPLTRYVDNWGRAGDLALVAHETGNRVGAAWFRLFTAGEPGYGFVDEQTPELSISVVPSRRRHGRGAGAARCAARKGGSGRAFRRLALGGGGLACGRLLRAERLRAQPANRTAGLS